MDLLVQFMWKADVVEAWITAKEPAVKSNDFGKDLSSVRMLLTKQETFDIGLEAFEKEYRTMGYAPGTIEDV